MKKFLIAPLLAFSLSGCATSFPGGTNVSGVLAQIQAFVAQACKFEATLTSIGAVVSALYPAGIPIVGGIEAVGNAICAAPILPGATRSAGVTLLRRSVQAGGRRIIVSGIAR